MPNWRKVLVSGSDASLHSLNVINGITGSLFGTASYALTASYTLNGGSGGGTIYVQDQGNNQGSASYFNFTGTGVTSSVSNGTASISIPGQIVTGSNAILVQTTPATTWSFVHNLGEQFPVFTIFDSSNNVIMPLNIHADSVYAASIYWSSPATGTAVAANCGLSGSIPFVTASYALTASYVAGASSFPFTGTAVITGSLVVTDTIALDGTLSDYNTVGSSTVGSNNLFTQATGSYTSAFFKYMVSNSTNARAGKVMAVWNDTTTNFTDTSTTDIGSTSAVTCSAIVVGSDIQFNITTGTSGWKLKSLATFM